MGREELEVGTVLDGRFVILGKLGSGTMGTVYEVEHLLTRHRRALKLLDPSLREHAETFERFRREASIAARLHDPRVVEVFDAGELPEGHAYVLMELLEGENLGETLSRRAPLPLAELSTLVRDAARGLHAAHEAGIVHRDVKPQNLFVTSAGVKVLDFGICRFDQDLTQLEARTADPSALGTPAYMSPEQVRGVRALDRRADVWALGVVLYVGATGKRPFVAGSLQELAVAIDRDRRVPLAEAGPSLPAAFVAVVERAMAHEPDQRFATAAALADALQPFTAWSEDATLDPRSPEPLATRDPAVTLDPSALVTAQKTAPPRPAPRFRAVWALVAVPLVALAIFAMRPRAPAPLAAAPSPSIAPSVTQVASSAPPIVVSAPPPASASSARPSAPPPTSKLPLHRSNPYQ